MNETAIREPTKRYLLIATVTEGKKGKALGSSSRSAIAGGKSGNSGDFITMQAKMMKNMDKKLNDLQTKVEKTLKDISDRIDTASSQQRNDWWYYLSSTLLASYLWY